MNKKLHADLTKTMEISIDIMQGLEFHCTLAEMKCIPHYLFAKTKNEAKKQGLELKQGAKRIGTMEWHIPSGGKAYGDLYLGSKFKPVESEKSTLKPPKRKITLTASIGGDSWENVSDALRSIADRIDHEGPITQLVSGGYDSGYWVTATENPEQTGDKYREDNRLYCQSLKNQEPSQ